VAPEPGFDLLTALPRFAPEVRLHPDDPHRPSSVEWYLKRTRLRLRRGLLCRDEELLPLGRVTSEKLGELTNRSDDPESLYLGIPRGAHRRDTRRGFRPVGGMLSAPCYVNARAAPDDSSAFDLQYWFFYPFNGREGRHIPHEGDWEHITVRVTNSADPRLLRTYISAHGQENGGWASPDGEESRGRILRLNSTGNPIIYSALGSHASYTAPGVQKQGWPKAGDRTSDGGPVWNTADDLVLSEVNGQPPDGNCSTHPWLRFQGRWGAIRGLARPFASSGPIGPSHQSPWTGEPPPGLS
jgi:hypothetical protein